MSAIGQRFEAVATEAAQVLHDYQSFIVGIIGFTGVALTLMVNSRLAREQVDTNLEHRRSAMIVGFHAELSSIVDAHAGNVARIRDMVEVGDQHSISLPSSPIDLFYRAQIGNIGLLRPEEVRAVMDAYLHHYEILRTLRIIGTLDPRGELVVESRYHATLLGALSGGLEKIRTVRDSLHPSA